MLAGALLAGTTLIVACEVKFEDNSITIVETHERGDATAPDRDDEVFMIVEEMPQLIGGMASLQQRIAYPALAELAGIEGRVFVQFVVNENGEVEDPTVVMGIGGGCDEEAVRAVRQARFMPGKQGGRAVNVKMTLPIVFELPGNASAPEAATGESLQAGEPHATTALEDQ